MRALLVAIAVMLLWVPAQAYIFHGHPRTGNSVVYYVNANSVRLPADQVIATIRAMADVWNAVGGLQLVYGGTTTRSGFRADGVNTIFFNPAPQGNALSADTFRWWDGAGIMYDSDIALFEGNYTYHIGSSCASGVYLENVIIHEFGHAMDIAHSPVTSATMYAQTFQCDLRLITLDPDDIAALRNHYPTLLILPRHLTLTHTTIPKGKGVH